MTLQDDVAAAGRERRQIWRDTATDRGLAAMVANPDDERHGTHTGYIYGCRCERCVVARRAYAAREDVKARKKERFARNLAAMVANPDDERHGTKTGYDYGCRCAACRAASSEYHRSRKSDEKGDRAP